MIFGEESKWASNVLHFTDWAEVVFSWSLPLHYKSKEKALLCKAFPVFMIFTYTSFDCVDHRPTTFNFCILSRFSSSEACTYRSNVIVTEVCPNISDNDLTSNPTSTARVANVCRYGIITTNRKSLYFQGVWAFVVFYSIPFPSWKLTKTIKKKGGCFINDKI